MFVHVEFVRHDHKKKYAVRNLYKSNQTRSPNQERNVVVLTTITLEASEMPHVVIGIAPFLSFNFRPPSISGPFSDNGRIL
jgi:hypothetical protein